MSRSGAIVVDLPPRIVTKQALVAAFSYSLLLCAGTSCLSYTNRTAYQGFNTLPLPAATSDPANPIVGFRFSRELTSHAGAVPLVWVMGEQGPLRLSVSVYGKGATRYTGFVLRSIRVISPRGSVFTSSDSTLVKKDSKSEIGYLFYTSEYSLSFNQPHPLRGKDLGNYQLQADYVLISRDGERKKYSIQVPMQVDRNKGLGI